MLFAGISSNSEERTSQFWEASTYDQLRIQLRREENRNVAKNVIFFIGDGMSLTTITASRIYQGQKRGERGEEGQLAFEAFPYVGAVKVRCYELSSN